MMVAKGKGQVLSRKKRYAARPADRRRRGEIATLAQFYLDRHQPTKYRINVVPDAIVLRGDTWLVVAEPSTADAPGHDFINRITEASMELEDKEKLSLFLVPVIPPEDD
jgi:hypothetical protein